MKRSLVGIAIATGVAFCGVQVLETLPELPAIGTEVVAHASDEDKIVDSGTLGSCPWTLTADGTLHVQSGELPVAAKLYDNYVTPFCDIQIREGGDHNNLKFNTISFEGKITTPPNASFLFAGFLSATPQIKHWEKLDTSASTNFSYMFFNSNQDKIDVSGLDTKRATNMHGMFSSTNLIEGYKNMDTSNVTDMGEMFENYGYDDNPASLDLSTFNVDKVNDDKSSNNFGYTVPGGFYRMFGMSNIKSLNIGNWTPKIPLDAMFEGSDVSRISKLTVSSQENLTKSELLGPDTTADKDPDTYTGKWENINDQYLRPNNPDKTTYTTDELTTKYDGSTVAAGDETYQWEPTVTPGNPVTIHYVDQDGKMIQADTQLPGALEAKYTIKPAAIKGYQYVGITEGSLTGTYTSDPQSVTLTYKVAPVTPVTPGGNDNNDSTGDQGHTPVIAKKDRAITAVKKLGFYRTPDFSKKTRQYYYDKQKRTLRPQFVITGVARSKSGLKRYLVRDVTPGSKRYGMTGYITAKRSFTVHTYYQHNPKRVKVILGTNIYRDKALKHRVRHLKRGTVLHVKKIVRYHLTTRLVLNNDSFVTSNKTKVIEK